MSKCATPYCKREGAGKYCHTCWSRRKRAKNPIRYSFDTNKANAKRRGKIWDLTFEQFKLYAVATDYIAGKGRTKDSWTIDCIVPELGYTETNIRPLQLSENASKGKKHLIYDWETGYATVETKKPTQRTEQDYF